jgi:Rrf2 family protein
MQTTRAADYAVRALIHLAGLPAGERLTLLGLASATSAPECFLSKVLQSLCRAGMIASHAGKSGGFELLEKGRNATVAAAIEAVDGPLLLNTCLVRANMCDRRLHCAAHRVWARAQTALLKALNEETIAELAAHQLAMPRHRKKSSGNFELSDA